MCRTRLRPAARAAAGALLLAALALPAACRSPDRGRPDVVLVSIDTLRADRLGCYGANRDTSPNLDAIAAEGARFADAFAPTSWTLPSHVSLLTGLGPLAHRVLETDDRIDAHRHTLTQQLSGQGYRTAGFVSAPFLHAAYGFDRGFDVYRNLGVRNDAPSIPPSDAEHQSSHEDETAAQVIDAALAWLAEHPADDVPIFLFVHLWDPHYDYIPPPPYDRFFDPRYAGDLDVRDYEKRVEINPGMALRDLQHLRALYDGEVRWTDSQIARLIEALRRRGRFDQTVFSVVSDHGEEFLEHGRRGHRHTVYDESVRVPWLLRYPPRIATGTVIEGTVSLEDVAPTLLELADSTPLVEVTGRSLVGALTGGGPLERPVLLHVKDRFALRGSDWKVLIDGDEALYFDLAADAGEMHGRPAETAAPERLAELRRRIASDRAVASRLRWEQGARVQLDSATRERLRELGYLDDSS